MNASSQVEEALRKYQEQLLTKLLLIREQLNAEVGDIAELRSKNEVLLAENSKLKKESERMLYRIQHLVKALNAEEAKH